ncbi:Ger(x)C family spore germination protein [Paenibacillus anseongense]|uniref:Ger(x)C family spore germination protein n=1 Tax=Paenibacillus anseongense TaxID=2682845 RepID=UPI002DB73188|nr:Ger(x)C family spore germination protein [Paenibacillus anseongense]MEC0264533.1 Ger(x)C family spore germination protein [Paenibacillus anseongense]
MKKFNVIFFLVLVMSLPLSLHLKKNVLEDLGMIIAAGYDELEGDSIKGTYVLHQIDPNSKTPVMRLTSEALTSKGARVAANRKSHKKLVSGQLRVAIFNEKLAKKGVLPLVDTLFRDASVSSTLYMAVSKGDVEDILMHKYPDIPDAGAYIVENIHQNVIREQFISSTLHEFLSNYYSLEDPMIPLIERKGESVELKNVAVFRGDRMVGTVNPNETFYLKLIRNRYKAGSFELSLDREDLGKVASQINDKQVRIVIENIQSDSKKKLISQNPLKFRVDVRMKGMLTESSAQLDLGKPAVIAALEQAITRKSEAEVQRLFGRLTAMQSDPIGFGEVLRSQVYRSHLTSEVWRDMYKSATFDVHFNLRIVRAGQVE